MSLQLTCYWFWECLHACEFSPIIIFFDAFPNLSGIEKLYSVAIDLNSIVKLKTKS